MPRNIEYQLCFSTSIAHLIEPDLPYDWIVHLVRQTHHVAWLDNQTPVNFDDVHKFERAVSRKIVVLFRTKKNHPLSRFETNSPKSDPPLYLYFVQGALFWGQEHQSILG